MRILVVGATGTIGRAIGAAMSAGIEIVSASLRNERDSAIIVASTMLTRC